MPTKAFSEANGLCRVEFRLPPEAGAERAWLAGEFNDWSLDAYPLERRPDGSLAVAVDLEPGRSYRFRYYLGDGEWENDWAADAYVENVHGGADSVVTVPPAPAEPPSAGTPPSKAAAKQPAAKKAATKTTAAKKTAAKKAAAVRTKKAPPPPPA